MEDKKVLKVSVRELVEFVLRSGDLVSGFTGSSRNVEGIKGHQTIQKSYGEEYTPEVTVSYLAERKEISLEVNGRIDGILLRNNEVLIDEIKTTTRPLEYIDEDYNVLHLSQAKCYGYIYGVQNSLEEVGVQLTYYQLDTKDIKYFKWSYTIEELVSFFNDLVDRYLHWAKLLRAWVEQRDDSISTLQFPFGHYRRGQRDLAVGVYKTIKEEGKLFAQAPTGIGKTMATLFPSIKALGEGLGSKVFYLTAKTITRTIAEKSLYSLKESGLKLKVITITAKEKICFNSECICDPEHCKYAKGHFDRVNEALEDIYEEDFYTREVIEDYALRHKICPFEFSLDLSYWCDVIICDYNYVFDPRVYLKRFFMDNDNDYIFLVDEAHNLVDRAREMFSAEIYKKPILKLKKEVKEKSLELSKVLNKLNNFMINIRKNIEEDEGLFYVEEEAPKEIFTLLRSFISSAEKWLSSGEESEFNDELMELYFEAMSFIRTSEYYDERYLTYYEKIEDDIKIKMFCVDTSQLMKEALKRGRAAILFSATLSPIDYYMKLLGGEDSSYKLKLESPFPKENLCLLVDDATSTKYRNRKLTYDRITENIEEIAKGKEGNYLVFFPSYIYMNEVYNRLIDKNLNFKIIYQKSNMTEEEKEEFLKEFESCCGRTLIGFAVMGGMFGEGIDLTGDKLLGAIVVGVGLPQICLERDIIKNHFEKTNGLGFEYGYVYPGMNKVMQAVGRVIRTDEDRGVVLLVDERFTQGTYKKLFPQEWSHGVIVGSCKEINNKVNEFWN